LPFGTDGGDDSADVWCLLAEFLQISDEILAILIFFEAWKHHLSMGDDILYVREVLVEVLFSPHESLRTERFKITRIGLPFDTCGLTPDDVVENRADLVLRTLSDVVTSLAFFEDVFSFRGISLGLHHARQDEAPDHCDHRH
jgi:hypothetical protein